MSLESLPWGFRWRSKASFIIITVGFGLFTDLVLYGIVLPILPFLLRLRFHIPPAQIQARDSDLLAIYSGASVLFSLPAGWAANRVGSRRLFLMGLGFLGAAMGMFAFSRVWWLMVVSRVLQGASTAVVWTTGMDMVQEAVPKAEIGEAIGTIFASISAGELVAPVLGGFLYDFGGMGAVFGVSAALLVIDLALRLLVIDRKAAMQYRVELDTGDDTQGADSNTRPATPQETDPLLYRSSEGSNSNDDTYDEEEYRIQGDHSSAIFTFMPMLHCFRSPRLHMAMVLSLVQALLTGALDATIPTEAESLFGFSSLQVGLIFIALMVPYGTLGRYFGQAVDNYGTRAVTTCGYIYLIPCVLMLALPGLHLVEGRWNIALFCLILAVNGVGIAAISSPAFVEAIDVVGRYDKANPELFGDNGPYAQLFGFNSLYFFAGLGLGPLVGGFLRAHFGWRGMGAAFAVLAALTALISFFMLGPERGSSSKKQSSEARAPLDED